MNQILTPFTNYSCLSAEGWDTIRKRIIYPTLFVYCLCFFLIGCSGGAGGAVANVIPAITSHPSNQSVVSGQTATFSVAVSGTPTPAVQWQRSNDSGVTWVSITGANALSYITQATIIGDNATQFRCQATNLLGTATSNPATLTVTTNGNVVAPSITTQPMNATAVVGQTATFSVAVSGIPTPTVQWQRSNDSGVTWVSITGANALSYITQATIIGDNATQFRCQATNILGAATSIPATLTVTINGIGIIYQQDFSTDPGFTSLSSAHAYWDSTAKNYYVKTRDNLAAKYWAYSPKFGLVDSSKPLSVEFDICFESQNWGTYPGVRFFASEPTEITNPCSIAVYNPYSSFHGKVISINNGFGSAGPQKDYVTNTVDDGAWSRVKIEYNGNGKASILVTNLGDNTVNYSQTEVDFVIGEFAYLGVGFYDHPDYGTDWSPIRIDNVVIRGTIKSNLDAPSAFVVPATKVNRIETISWMLSAITHPSGIYHQHPKFNKNQPGNFQNRFITNKP